VLLYEAYQDDAAFEAHLASPHYLAWQAGRSDLVVDGSQVVERFDLVESEPDR
jgi:quinol monooxygenase YgiN